MQTTKIKQNTAVALKTAEASVVGLRMSPRKMRLVTNMVKGMPALDAIQQLRFTNKKAAKFVLDVIQSAVANAENNFKLNGEHLYVKTITCDMGTKLKRYMPRAQGRASEIRRPTSHVHVTLEERLTSRKAKATAQVSAKKENLIKETASVSADDSKNEQKGEPKAKSGPKGQVSKTNEQRKTSTVQQKRRLFNRKSGV